MQDRAPEAVEGEGQIISFNPGNTPSLEPKCPKCKGSGVETTKGYYNACDCPIGVAKLAASREHEYELRRDRSGIPNRYYSAQMEDFDIQGSGEQGLAICRWLELCRQGEEVGVLYIWGPVGSGKTHLAAAVADDVMHDRWVRFVVMGELLLTIQESFGKPPQRGRDGSGYQDESEEREKTAEEVWDDVCGEGVLVVDDIATEYITEWAKSRIFLLVNHRYNATSPTVITTNLDPQALSERIGDRTVSRLMHGATVIHLTGKDQRLGDAPGG